MWGMRKSKTGVAAGTIVYTDELPNAAVLVNSFQRFHPETDFAVLVIAGRGEEITLPQATVLRLNDLGLDSGEEWRLPMLFRREELRSLLKPILLEAMLGRGAGTAAYVSPVTDIFAPLFEVLALVSEANEIVATPSLNNEGGDCGRSFLAAPDAAKPLLREWFDKMRALSDPKVAAPIDHPARFEKLFDRVPQRVLSEPGFAINYTNLDAETFRRSQQGYEIDGQPLQSFDFRGYYPSRPHLLSRYQGLVPQILLSEWPVVAELCDGYRAKLIGAGHSADRAQRHEFDFLPCGLQLDQRMLRIYGAAHEQRRLDNSDEPPSPFGPAGEKGFLEWLNEPVDQANAGVTRYMLAVYHDREDVQAAFPDPTKADAARFRDWYRMFGQHELNLPAALVPSRQVSLEATPRQVAVNIAGYFRAELGIGTAARSLVAALEAGGIPFNTISFGATANRQSHPFVDRQTESLADINIVCVNAAEFPAFAREAGGELLPGRYTIGVWFWEAEDFPKCFHDSFNYVDEIWVASEFMRETFLKVSPKPVFKFRLPVLTPPIDPSVTRKQLGLPDQFIFLFSFDFLSVLERKNPLGLIEAFCGAFPANTGPRLVIRTINGDKRILEMEKLKYASRNRPDIVLMDGYLPPVENATVTALSDCYVSLHRSEGFGLTVAEAMALGKPVIATAYSGNLEFMTPENSYLCPARRCEVGPEREPYPASSHWSEPDIEAARHLLRHVYEHQNEARNKGQRAATDIRSLHSPTSAAPVIRGRLDKIRNRRARSGPARDVTFLEDRLEELGETSSPR
jgi:glycosyltransferase involved in cell wall biosynthesis